MTIAAAELASLAIEDVFLRLLDIAPWNARKTYDAASLKELAASIEQHGLQVPLLLRPKPDGDRLEIVAGHRRFWAAETLGRETLPCIVREMSDDEAREIGLVDNLQREDVPALEEADAYAELLPRLGTAGIALRVGKDIAHVARTLKLCDLGELPRKALDERLITVDHALLLARLGADEQDANLKWTLDRNAGSKTKTGNVLAEAAKRLDKKDGGGWNSYWEPQSVKELKAHIEQSVGRKLSRAPWSLLAAGLVKDAPACDVCPSNTAHNDTLFGDMNISAATCENGECFEMKRVAFVTIALGQASAKQEAGRGPAVRLSWKETSVKPRFSEAKAGTVMVDESGVNLLQVFKVGQWIEAKPKSCAHVRLGVTVDWSDDASRGYMGRDEKLRKPGQTLTVCIAPGCKTHKKRWEKPKQSAEPGTRNQNTAAADAERKRKAELAKLENAVRADLVKRSLAGVQKLSGEILRRIALMALPDEWNRVGGADEMFPGLDKALGASKPESIEFARAAASVLLIQDRSDVWVDEWEAADKGRKEFIALLKDLGYDASKAWDKLAAPKAEKKTPAKTTVAKQVKATMKRVVEAAGRKVVADAKKLRAKNPAKKAAKKAGRK